MNEKEIGVEQARAKLGQLVDDAAVEGQVTYLTRRGRRYAAIVPISLVPQETSMPTIADTEIYDDFPGRSFGGYDLLDEMTERYGLGRTEAHESIHAFLGQCVEIDRDAVIVDRRPVRPELLDDNPSDLDIRYWLTITGATAETIRESFAATYAAEDE